MPLFRTKAYITCWMASCVAIHWPPNGQWTKCMPHASNPCAIACEKIIKLRQKCNIEIKIECVMRNKWIDGLAINHSPAPLHEQEQMQALDAKEMESSSKIDLRDVLWWMPIKKTYKPRALVITKLSKERWFSLATWWKPSCVTRRHDWSKCRPPFNMRNILFQKSPIKNTKLKTQIQSH
jgi:hypothetical protein